MSRAITSARMRRSVVLAACCGILIAGFLMRPAPSASAAPRVVRPGDSLLDRGFLDGAVVEKLPRTNLPEDLVEVVRGVLPFRAAPLNENSWKGPIPVDRKRIGRIVVSENLKAWNTLVPLKADTKAGPVRFFTDGRELVFPPLSEMAGKTAPDPYLYWDEQAGTVQALCSRRPPEIRVECFVDPRSQLATCEGRFLDSLARDPALVATEPVAASGLVRRITISNVTTTGLLLPAPGAVAIPIDRMEGDTLRFNVAVAKQQLKLIDGCYEPVDGRSDGVVVAVEVGADGTTTRVWSNRIGRKEVGTKRLEASVDLSRWRDRGLTLRFVTEPGPAGDSDFDYAFWSGLRIDGRMARSPTAPHVVLVDIDTLRADRLGCYGYERPTTPRFDAWARDEAAIYLDTLSTASWTLPATASMLTGMFVHQHGIDKFPKSLSNATPTLASLLRQHGYETFAIAEGGYVLPSFGFALGFDEFRLAKVRDHEMPDWSPAFAWLRRRRSEHPTFLFLHTYLMHAPYPHDEHFADPGASYAGPLAGKAVEQRSIIDPFNARRLELDEADRAYVVRQYDAQLRRMDELVAGLLHELNLLFRGEDWMLVFTSDHGEELFDHGAIGHGNSLYHELLRVPLVVRYPANVVPRPIGSFDEPASLVDIVPTILSVAGIEVPEYLPGRPLHLPMAEPPPRLHSRDGRKEAITRGPWKLIRTRRPLLGTTEYEFYSLESDPFERSNLHEAQADDSRRLETLFRRWSDLYPLRQATASASGLGTEALDALAELGYAGGEPAAADDDDER